MENERIYRINFFGPACNRLLHSKNYWMHLILALFLSVISPYVLEIFQETTSQMPVEVRESFKVGNVYNIGVLSVSSLHVLENTYMDEILRGILSSAFIQYLLGTVLTFFICSEYKNGYINFAIVHGQKRWKLYLKFMGLAIVAVIPMIAIYMAGVALGLHSKGILKIQNMKALWELYFYQILMLLGISICVSSFVLVVQGYRAVWMVFAGLLVLPLLPQYVLVFSKNKFKIDGYSLVTQLMCSAEEGISNPVWIWLLVILTAAVFVGVGLIIFCRRDYN